MKYIGENAIKKLISLIKGDLATKQPTITASGLLKGDGAGTVTAADTQEATLVDVPNGLLKGDGTTISQAVAGTDYAAASHNHDSSYLKLSGGKLTGNLTGKYITGTWLQTTEATALGSAATKICVLDGSGWVYYRTPEQIRSDIGVPAAISSAKKYTDEKFYTINYGDTSINLHSIVTNAKEGVIVRCIKENYSDESEFYYLTGYNSYVDSMTSPDGNSSVSAPVYNLWFTSSSGNTIEVYSGLAEATDGIVTKIYYRTDLEKSEMLRSRVAFSTNGIAYTISSSYSQYQKGDSLMVRFNKGSTSINCTLNINNLGAKPLRIRSAKTGLPVVPTNSNWISQGQIVQVTYDGAYFVVDVVNAATMDEVNSAIQTAIGNAIGGSY